jgi:hypothetical protein
MKRRFFPVKYPWLLIAIIAFAAMPATIWAQDVSGEWSGALVSNRGIVRAVFDLSVDGTKLTGSAIAGDEERPLFDGKIKGNKISFILRRYTGDKFVPFIYEGKIQGNTIQFTLTWVVNQSRQSRQFTATRVKRR